MSIDTSATIEWLARHAAAVAPVLPGYFDIVADHAEGSWLWDVDGRRYLDLGAGIAVTNTGHRHPHVVAAIHTQVDRLHHTSVVVKHQPYVEAAEAIGRLTAFFEDPQVFFCNSGAEAVDGLLKLARRATGRSHVLAFQRAFHGRTIAATSLTTAKASYQEGYSPLLPGVHLAPYCVPGPTSGQPSDDAVVATALDAVDQVLRSHGKEIGVMLVEPVLGEGGYVVPPSVWLQGLRARCDEHGILLAFDEVQCGFGRTGKPFAAEAFGVTPDVVLFAKAVASGLPLGGLVAPAAVMASWPKGAHGSTFGGNPVACAAAVATIEVIEREGLCERALVIGERIMSRLRSLEASSVLEVRGLGGMVGVELTDRATAAAVQQRCVDEGVLVLTCGPTGSVLRLIPPLTISDEELEHGLSVLAAALMDH